MTLSFDVELAQKIGINAAIVYGFIENQILLNTIDGECFHNDTCHCDMSIEEMQDNVKVMTANNIEIILELLGIIGYIETVYIEEIDGYWYALGENKLTNPF